MSTKDIFYGSNDTDVEHLSREVTPPPRVLDVYQLHKIGLDMNAIICIYGLMTAGVGEKQPTCNYLYQNFNTKTIDHRAKEYGTIGKEVRTKHGIIELVIDIRPNMIAAKRKMKCQNFDRDWSVHAMLIFNSMLDKYVRTVFPMYAHFILKSTPIVPLPVPYMEFYLKAQYSNDTNVFSDLSILDLY